MKSKSFEDVELWKKAHKWVIAIYRFTAAFPKHELFGLTSQLRRAAVSVPANFAEGFKKRGIADKIRIYNIAQGLALWGLAYPDVGSRRDKQDVR